MKISNNNRKFRLKKKGATPLLSYANIYPNPATSQINIEYKCKTDGTFVLYNNIGQEVMRTDLKNTTSKVSLLTSNLTAGVYAFRCIFTGCEAKNGKLTIVKH